ncbi:MAG: hypothetical protein M0R80_16465 [Proteobacteria bacterium]|nr:hypothetical protein [Pseudomonadota bacterium]
MLGRHFDEVHVVTSGAEGDAVLEKTRVTHLVCDQSLGEDDPPGLELVPRWRKEHPSIERAIILTGFHQASLSAGPGVDAIVSKLAETSTLLRVLGVG